MKRSVMLTGAPVTGKSTLTRSLRSEFGYISSPDYTTRPIRPDEIDGVDRHFISTEEFERLHQTGRIIEPTLDYCNYQGNYYGSPTEWLSEEELGDNKVLTCVAVGIAGLIHRQNSGLIWVHLEAENTERADRLVMRGIDQDEVTRRLANQGGDSHISPDDADLILNTSILSLDATLATIMETAQC
jgi:guanylate kinase